MKSFYIGVGGVNPLVEKTPPTKRPVQVARADRESYLSLVDGTCTHIRPRVQPFSMIGLGWLAYVRAVYRDSANNESHPPLHSMFENKRVSVARPRNPFWGVGGRKRCAT